MEISDVRVGDPKSEPLKKEFCDQRMMQKLILDGEYEFARRGVEQKGGRLCGAGGSLQKLQQP